MTSLPSEGHFKQLQPIVQAGIKRTVTLEPRTSCRDLLMEEGPRDDMFVPKTSV